MEEASKTIKPHFLSLCTVQLHMKFNDTSLAIGTGFFYKLKEKIYFITNWHNVTGRDPFKKIRLNQENYSFPNRITFKLPSKENAANKYSKELFLYDDKEFENPSWLVHPTFKESVDVIVIEFSLDEIEPDVLVRPFNNQEFFKQKLNSSIADDVFALGYPKGLNYGFNLPVWKKGSIASEPDVDYKDLPLLLIDTATREGMSGSPVVFKKSSPISEGIIGDIFDFLGIYSARIGDLKDLQLGYVWKQSVIDEIINGGIKGTTEFKCWD